MVVLLVALGGALGSVARYLISGWVQSATGPSFPWGTLVVNVTGSLLLAFLARMLEGLAMPPEWRGFLTLGFCGAYTTFSTFSFETANMLQGDQWFRAVAYIGSSVILTLAAVAAGFWLAALALGAREIL